jgi:flagellar biosynthetic protein FlhB
VADRDEKIFPALPHKRQRAREQGDVARSRDLTAALTFAGAVVAIAAGLPFLGRAALAAFGHALAVSGTNELGHAAGAALWWPMLAATGAAGLFALLALGGTAVQELIVLTPGRLAPDWTRLNPLNYFARAFSMAGLLELGKAGAKISLVALLGWRTARWALDSGTKIDSVNQGLAVMAAGVRRLLGWSAAIAVAAAAADYAHKRYEHEAELRMTRQEFLDQLKEEEGNPQIRRALRRAMRKSAKRIRGIHQAATASVVLTNPTHYAVALRYRRGFDVAPLVVAKGAGENAHRVIAIARMAAVPVMQNRPLARALFRGVEVGETIPRQFYRAVAEVLSMIMRAEAQRRAAAMPAGSETR